MKEISGVYLILINHLNNLILIFLSKNYFSIFILFYFFFLYLLFSERKKYKYVWYIYILYIFIYIMLKYTLNYLIINYKPIFTFFGHPQISEITKKSPKTPLIIK